MNRRSFLTTTAAASLLALKPVPAEACFRRRRTSCSIGSPLPVAEHPKAELITPETQAVIERGLTYLSNNQNPDGSFTDLFDGASVGVTALVGLALIAGGHLPGRGRYAHTVSRVVDFVVAAGSGTTPGFLATVEATPSLRGVNQQAMYSHGFGCLFLSEVCARLPDQKKVKDALERAIGFTVQARNKEGGWRYQAQPPVADVSVTVTQMMALRAAKKAGVFVRNNVIDDGVAYIRGCQMPDGGFSYFKGQGFSAFARSAAAIVGLYSGGIYSGGDIDRGLNYLQQFLPVRPFTAREIPPQHYYYGHYYAALAMRGAGGDYWSKWFPAIRDDLLSRADAGVWSDRSTNKPAYATAMSLIILQLPNNKMPILQG